MVWQVLEDVADGKSWDFISQVRWGGRLPVAAIAEAVRLAKRAFLDPEGNLLRKPGRERSGEPVTVELVILPDDFHQRRLVLREQREILHRYPR